MSENKCGLSLKKSEEHVTPPMQTPAQRLADVEEAVVELEARIAKLEPKLKQKKSDDD